MSALSSLCYFVYIRFERAGGVNCETFIYSNRAHCVAAAVILRLGESKLIHLCIKGLLLILLGCAYLLLKARANFGVLIRDLPYTFDATETKTNA